MDFTRSLILLAALVALPALSLPEGLDHHANANEQRWLNAYSHTRHYRNVVRSSRAGELIVTHAINNWINLRRNLNNTNEARRMIQLYISEARDRERLLGVMARHKRPIKRSVLAHQIIRNPSFLRVSARNRFAKAERLFIADLKKAMTVWASELKGEVSIVKTPPRAVAGEK